MTNQPDIFEMCQILLKCVKLKKVIDTFHLWSDMVLFLLLLYILYYYLLPKNEMRQMCQIKKRKEISEKKKGRENLSMFFISKNLIENGKKLDSFDTFQNIGWLVPGT